MPKLLKTDLSLFIPAFILSLCIIELAIGTLVPLMAVRFFYVYLIFFVFFRIRQVSYSLNTKLVWIYFLAVGLYVFAASFGRLYDTVSAELFNILWWTTFSFLVALECLNKQRCLLFMKYLSVLIFIGTFLAAAAGLYKVYVLEVLLQILPFTVYEGDNSLMQGSTLNPDYNLYTLGLIFGVLCGKFLKDNSQGKFFAYLSNLAFPFFCLSIFFSGSRRGIFFLAILVLIYFMFTFKISVPVNKTPLKKLMRFAGIFVLFVSLFLAGFSLFEKAIESAGFVSGVQRLTTIKEQVTNKKGDNERTKRLDYLLERLPQETHIKNVLFGGGFYYLEILGKQFNYGADDNPHNFLIATYLYGGILSLIVVLTLIYFSVRATLYRGEFTLFFYFVILTVIFSLTSSHTLFAYRFVPVILVLPLLVTFTNNRLDLNNTR